MFGVPDMVMRLFRGIRKRLDSPKYNCLIRVLPMKSCDVLIIVYICSTTSRKTFVERSKLIIFVALTG